MTVEEAVELLVAAGIEVDLEPVNATGPMVGLVGAGGLVRLARIVELLRQLRQDDLLDPARQLVASHYAAQRRAPARRLDIDGNRLMLGGTDVALLLPEAPPQFLEQLVAAWNHECGPALILSKAGVEALLRGKGGT